MQCACAILSSVACPALQHFSTLSHKRHDFRKKKVIVHEVCVWIFFTTIVWNIFHSKNNSEIWKNYISLYVKYLLFLSSFIETWISSTEFQELLKYKISRKSAQWEMSSSMRTDGRKGVSKQMVAFRNFSNAFKIFTSYLVENMDIVSLWFIQLSSYFPCFRPETLWLMYRILELYVGFARNRMKSIGWCQKG
jgi:hypothetical protein